MLYHIQLLEETEPTLILHQEIADSFQLTEEKEIILSFGKRTGAVSVKTHSDAERHLLYISSNLIQTLLIDTGLKYEISITENTLILGPVIGLLLGRKEDKLVKNLQRFLVYTMLYKQINGLLFVYCEEGIDFLKEQISGYIFDENSEAKWRRSTMPFPGASFRRVELSSKTFKRLIEKMGRTFFNSSYFNKWHFWSLVSPVPELREHLPETTNAVNLNSLNLYIDKYGGVYLKPRNGSRGQGIHYITKKSGLYEWIKNYEDEAKLYTEDEMGNLLRKYRFYLLQQPINLQTYENRKIDYRVLLQKNETGLWQCTGIIARFGKCGAISSNFKANGYAVDGVAALKRQFGYEDLQVFQKYEEIIDVCVRIACQIDENGAYGDLGIDIGIDGNGKVWVIEINKRPDHDFPLLINNRKMYYMVKVNPVLYAKYIAMGGT